MGHLCVQWVEGAREHNELTLDYSLDRGDWGQARMYITTYYHILELPYHR